jgi:hypothetical protein
LITVALTATIDATDGCVWNAVVDPAERRRWDDRVLGEIRIPRSDDRLLRSTRRARIDLHADAIRRTCWRFRISGIPLVMVDETHRIDGRERVFGRITIGSMHFDQTITVHAAHDRSGPHTRLGMKLVAANSIAVIGELVPRLEVQRILIEYVDRTLRQIRKYCEALEQPGPADREPDPCRFPGRVVAL